MGTYIFECGSCGSSCTTSFWEPEECPICESGRLAGQITERDTEIASLRADLASARATIDAWERSAEGMRAEVVRLTAEVEARPAIDAGDSQMLVRVLEADPKDPFVPALPWFGNVLDALRVHAKEKK